MTETGSITEQLSALVPEVKEAAPAELETRGLQPKRQRGKAGLYTGRRKTSIARVKVTPGTGKFSVNHKDYTEYFSRKDLQFAARLPLIAGAVEGQYDVFATVKGGGVRGQAEAVSLGLARSLQENDPSLHQKMHNAGLLTRDSRMVERKKYGLHKARKASQFSKR